MFLAMHSSVAIAIRPDNDGTRYSVWARFFTQLFDALIPTSIVKIEDHPELTIIAPILPAFPISPTLPSVLLFLSLGTLSRHQHQGCYAC